MLENIVKQEMIFYVMGILVGIGVIAKVISTITVRKIVKAASEINKSNHKLMRLVKAKFEHASMISDKVQNVGAFVDKYIYEYKILGIRLNTWRTMTKKLLLLVGILGLFGIFESCRMKGVGDLMLGYVQWTGIFVLFLALLYFIGEESSRILAARNYMVEYFENVCISRYVKKHRETESVEETAEEAAVAAEEMTVETPEANRQMAEQNTRQEAEQSAEIQEEEKKKSEQEMRIRAILEEFLA